MLKIRGVISFTFQMAVKRCVVRIRSDLKAEVKCLSGHRKSLLSSGTHIWTLRLIPVSFGKRVLIYGMIRALLLTVWEVVFKIGILNIK